MTLTPNLFFQLLAVHMQHHNNNCVVLLRHWSSFYSSMTQPWNSMRMCTVYLIVKCLSSCIFALIFALSPSAISQNGLFLKWRFDYHITLNLGYLSVKYAGSDVCLIQEGNNILHLTLSGIRNANSNITTPNTFVIIFWGLQYLQLTQNPYYNVVEC